MKPTPLIAFVDHEIGHRLLQRLIDEHARGGIALVAVVTTQDNGQRWWPGVAPLCEAAGLPLHRFGPGLQPHDLPEAELHLLLSWKHLMPAPWLARPRRGTLNLHYSLLPAHRGPYPVNWALIQGDRRTGVSLHWVDERVDHGPLLLQRALDIAPDDTARSLQRRLDDLAASAFDELLPWLRDPAQPAPTASADAPASYHSAADFAAGAALDPDSTWRAGDLINLLRGRSFLPDSRLLHLTDPATGRRVYLRLELEDEAAPPPAEPPN